MLEWVTERLLALVEQFATLRKDQRDLRDNALRAISHALNETCLYYRDLGHGRPRNEDIEAQLSRYWSAAAIPIRHFDAELARVCEEKSEYWIDPDSWPADRVAAAGIGLDNVRRQYRALLYPQFAKRFQKRSS
jgi:hypothetical protein